MAKVDGWTDGRYNSFIASTLRSGMRRWPPKWQCLKDAYVGKEVGPTGRAGSRYKCAKCGSHFPSSAVQVDHIVPVVATNSGFTSWDDYIDRLFCEKANLQVLCKPCHKVKTKEEKKCRSQTTTPGRTKQSRKKSTVDSSPAPPTPRGKQKKKRTGNTGLKACPK